MYAVVTTAFRGIYSDPRAIDNILKLYPYTKFRKFKTEEECWEYLAQNTSTASVEGIHDYGDTFKNHHVVMRYIVTPSTLYYSFDTSKVGILRISDPNAVIDNRSKLITARIDGIVSDNDKIPSHLIAIYHGLRLLGDFIDVEVVVPDISIYYAIAAYTGDNRHVSRLKRAISERTGNVSITVGDCYV